MCECSSWSAAAQHTTLVAVGGCADTLTSTDIGVAEGSLTAVGDSLQLGGTGTTYEDFIWQTALANTFGAVNTGQSFGHNPFAGLSREGLPSALEATPGETVDRTPTEPRPARRNRGRVDILRHTAHRGGKTVTVVTGFVGIGLPEKKSLAKAMQTACGTGGTVKEGRIEIQGDKREEVARILSEAGFRPVFAGG